MGRTNRSLHRYRRQERLDINLAGIAMLATVIASAVLIFAPLYL